MTLYNCKIMNYSRHWMQAKCLESFGILPGGRWARRIYPLLWTTFSVFPTKLSEFLLSVLKALFESVLSRLQILGHGQGMTAYYVMLDQHPDLASKISLTTSMAPITYGAHTTGLLRLCSRFLISLPHWLTVGRIKVVLLPNISLLAKFISASLKFTGLPDR